MTDAEEAHQHSRVRPDDAGPERVISKHDATRVSASTEELGIEEAEGEPVTAKDGGPVIGRLSVPDGIDGRLEGRLCRIGR